MHFYYMAFGQQSLEEALRIYPHDLTGAESIIEYLKTGHLTPRFHEEHNTDDYQVFLEDLRKVDEVIQHYRRNKKASSGGQPDEAKTETTTTKEV